MTTTKKHLLETATLVSESASEDGAWKVRVISEGKGSSGIYTASLLENHHKAFNDVLSFRNHPNWYEGPQVRDFTMIAGEVRGETWVETQEDGTKAIFANYVPDPEFKDKLERYKDKLGLSIYIEGSGFENEEGEFVVDWFNPEDPYASLDVVIAPGARGKFMESAGYMESLKEMYAVRENDGKGSPGARQANEKEIPVDELKEVKEALAALASQVATLVTDKTNAEAAKAQVEADAEAVTSAVEAYDIAVKAIDEAELLPVQVESLRTLARKGGDVTVAIAEAKAIKDAAVEAVKVEETANQGRVFGSTRVESAADLGKVFG